MNVELTGDETNSDLQTICDELGLTVEAKNPKKPNKTELITAIEKNVPSEGVAEEVSAEEYAEFMGTAEVAEEAEPVVKKKVRKTRKQLKDELFPLRRVQVTNNDETQTKRDVMFITWGNDVIGHNTDRLLMGRPWHIREGALRNLKGNTMYKSVPHPETGEPEYIEMPAFNIIDLPMLTLPEYKALGKKQEIRDAAASAMTI